MLPDVNRSAHSAVVIGGGVVGLAAAWHLLQLGCRPVTVLERFRVGHGAGGSHGSARMTRSTYSSAVYASLMRHVREVEWPRLERAAGVTLVRPLDVVFFGPDRATLADYATAVAAAGAPSTICRSPRRASGFPACGSATTSTSWPIGPAGPSPRP